MYTNVSDDFKTAIRSDARTVRVRLTFSALSPERVFDGHTVVSYSINEVVNANNSQITMGCFCANKASITLVDAPKDITYVGQKIKPEIGIETGLDDDDEPVFEYVPLGVFWISDAETYDNYHTLQITAYSVPADIEKSIGATTPGEVSLNTIFQNLKSDLNSLAHITLNEMPADMWGNLGSATVPGFYDEAHTLRETVQYLAGLLGCNVRMERDGSMSFFWYGAVSGDVAVFDVDIPTGVLNYTTDDGYAGSTFTMDENGYLIETESGSGGGDGLQITRNLQYMAEAKETTQATLRVTGVVSGTEQNKITKTDGAAGVIIAYTNKYMTQEIMNNIYSLRIRPGGLDYFSYMPCEIKWRGDPCLQAGDVIEFVSLDINDAPITYSTVVMEHSLAIGGGLNDTVYAYGDTENKTTLSSEHNSISVAVPNRISLSVEKITGNNGGFAYLHDTNNDGYADEFVIANAQNINEATSVWRWNQAGLMHANDYSGSWSDVAIANDGTIAGQSVSSGSLDVGKLNADYVNGVINDINASKQEVLDALNNYKALVAQYLEFTSTEGLVIGCVGSDFKTQLTNEELGFWDGNTKVAYINGNKFNIRFGEIMNSLKIANYAFKPRTNGNLSIVLYQEEE